MGSTEPLTRLAGRLGAADALEHAGEARVGATLALVRELDADHEIVYTRRRDDLRTHPGQISFPGGRVDAGETVAEAALREASEEVGLKPSSVTVLGALPAFYVPPSRFWLQTVVARWDRPHALAPAEDEVAEILRARVSALSDPERWRRVRLSVTGWTWAWHLDAAHLLWGATAVMTAMLLDDLAPDWHGGTRPSELAPERTAQPWLAAPSGAGRRAWLPDLPAVDVEACPPPWPAPPSPERERAAGAACADMARRLGAQRVVVLAGGGGNGRVGLAAAQRLAGEGRDVTVVTDRPVSDLPEASRRLLDGLETRPRPAELPRADLYVDALVGGGLVGALEGGAREVMLALRRRDAPVLAIDLPSGLDGEAGTVGECVPAMLSLALGGPRPGVLAPGVEPFAGDLYAVDERGRLVRLLHQPPSGWRE